LVGCPGFKIPTATSDIEPIHTSGPEPHREQGN
jgi:hypothetical protein